MKNKLFLIMLLGLFFISFVSAEMVCDGTYLGNFYINQTFNLSQVCPHCSYVTLSSITSPSGLITINENMSKVGINFYYSVNAISSGEYFYDVFGDKEGIISSEHFCFEVKPYIPKSDFGLDLSSPIVIIIIAIFIILALLMILLFHLYIFGGLVLLAVGFILLYSGFNPILSVILIVGGVLSFFLKK